ncbi:hypothetical protein K2173_023030 [Erythroxylum novogranatense]|uniref:Integrase catalytic domain-containing protein n=1 Tax=Erythroxylum novogranatense TaxID=1862640 RepID=A0AAV8T962_9ROSI|nr:hypothetical protein K2173_023030 [Erythroxylum novogranatense]
MSTFWQEMFRQSGTKLHMSSAYHPQTDGQTEVVNRCLETYLRCFVSDHPKEWPHWLSWAEYWFNTTYSSAIGMSPFKALYGREPPTLLKYTDEGSLVEDINQQLVDRNQILEELKSNLLRAQQQMKKYADEKRRPMNFEELQINFSQYEHPVVLTVEAQAKYVGDKGAGLSKNLFLKDKKNRFYIVSALADTKVDMKVLSQRLGLGKGGIRMAPEDALGEILQVTLGCVTPFALINESARHVSLLLDKGFRNQEKCIFHPLSNDTSISLTVDDLDKFLKSVGRDSSYVDLEANPPVGKDSPPDLAALVPSDSVNISGTADNATPMQSLEVKSIPADKKSTTVSVNSTKPSGNAQDPKNKSGDVHKPSAVSDVELFVDEILKKTSNLVLSEINEDTIRQHGVNLGTILADDFRKRLNSDLKSLATMFKNTAYTQGFHAGTNCKPKRL